MDSPVFLSYRLRDLFREIDYFDRKIAFSQDHEVFEAESERAAALAKLVKSRVKLVNQADDLKKTGATCDPKDLPRSFKDREQKSNDHGKEPAQVA